MITRSEGHKRLAPEHFYWGVLEKGSLARGTFGGTIDPGFLFESVLPVPIESVHAVYSSVGSGRLLACAMDRDVLRAHTDPDVVAITPASLPPFLLERGVDIDLDTLQLLTCEFEPLVMRRARRRAVVLVIAAIQVCALLVGLGQLRRAEALRRTAAVHELATAELYAKVLSPGHGDLPAPARLLAELRSLERTRTTGPELRRPVEVAPLLAHVLASWPAGLHLTTDSVSASSELITLAVRLEDEPGAEEFERAIAAPAGWRTSQPDVQRERDAILVRFRMEPERAP